MNKTDFEPTFKLLCANPERSLSQEQLIDKRDLFWLKFGKLDKDTFFSACMAWIDKSKFMPNVNQIREIIDSQESANRGPEQIPVYVPKDNWKRRREIGQQCKKAIAQGKARCLARETKHAADRDRPGLEVIPKKIIIE